MEENENGERIYLAYQVIYATAHGKIRHYFHGDFWFRGQK